MPTAIAVSMPAAAQYGFASEAGVRSSIRVAFGDSTSDRIETVRLSPPHETFTGANESSSNRLYELTLGEPYSAMPGRWLMSPPSDASMSGFSAPSSGAKAGLPSFHSEACRCIELPDSLLNGFAMNVALAPARRATSRIAYLRRTP